MTPIRSGPRSDPGLPQVAPLLVLAIGNPSRGDDALGPALVDALREAGAEAAGDIELMTDFQLQVEHALDLVGRQAVLFVDAAQPGSVGGGGVALGPLVAVEAPVVLSHALAPGAVLQVAQRLGLALPLCWLLAVEGQGFELGAGLSAPARQRLGEACTLARNWLDERRASKDATMGSGRE